MYLIRPIAIAFFAICFVACTEDNPDETGDLPDAGPGEGEPCPEEELDLEIDISLCQPSETDYTPWADNSAEDEWPACISDDNSYHQIEDSISSIARVEAYDQIGLLLWENNSVSPQDFVDARVLYEEEQGLGSRVARRFDPHYPSPDSGSCEDEGIPEKYPDYCVGPAILQPIVTDAFAAGAKGDYLVVNSAIIEAALQWFLYVSAIKEATTCAETPKDCDSSWAYYSGGTPRESPIGLAADIDRFVKHTHDRIYDGILAVRCWRDLDQAVPAEDEELQARAIEQLDVALLHGMAVLVRQRFAALECSTGEYQLGALESLRILVPLLDRETMERDSSAADHLLDQIELDANDVDLESVISILDTTYNCP